jgi:hypothetical protein
MHGLAARDLIHAATTSNQPEDFNVLPVDLLLFYCLGRAALEASCRKTWFSASGPPVPEFHPREKRSSVVAVVSLETKDALGVSVEEEIGRLGVEIESFEAFEALLGGPGGMVRAE